MFVVTPALEPYLPWIYMRKGRGAELRSQTPQYVVNDALRLTFPCAGCGGSHHPFRRREEAYGRGRVLPAIYFAPTCGRAACSRGTPARDAMVVLKAALRGEFQGTLL